jgi:hypothetical protein
MTLREGLAINKLKFALLWAETGAKRNVEINAIRSTA